MKLDIPIKLIKITAFKCPYCKFISPTVSGIKNHINQCRKNSDIKLCKKCKNLLYSGDKDEVWVCKFNLKISRYSVNCDFFHKNERKNTNGYHLNSKYSTKIY